MENRAGEQHTARNVHFYTPKNVHKCANGSFWYGTLKLSGAVIKVICSICDFPAMISQNICCKEGLFCATIHSPAFDVRLTTQLITSTNIMEFNSMTFIKADLHCKHVKLFKHITFLISETRLLTCGPFSCSVLAPAEDSCSVSRQVDTSVVPGLGLSPCRCHHSSSSNRRFPSPAFPLPSSSVTTTMGEGET